MKRHGGNERTSGREEATRSVIPTARRSGDGETAETASRAAVARGGAGCGGGGASTVRLLRMIVDTCPQTSVQTHGLCNPRGAGSACDADRGLRAIITCQGRSVTCDECTTLGGDARDWGQCVRVGPGDMGQNLPLDFAVNLKLLLKK